MDYIISQTCWDLAYYLQNYVSPGYKTPSLYGVTKKFYIALMAANMVKPDFGNEENYLPLYINGTSVSLLINLRKKALQ